MQCFYVQASLLGAIAYFILPFDFVADMLPILGFTDDAAILATALRVVASHITPEHREAARAALKRGIESSRTGRKQTPLSSSAKAGGPSTPRRRD